jgi:sulfur-oxidizing protein SoxY
MTTRREALWLVMGGLAGVALAQTAGAKTLDELTAAFTGGVAPEEGGVTLTAPEIAENGNAVPVSVSAPGAVAIMLLSTGNPEPGIATFTFGPASGGQTAATRIRLATTQDVVALAKMADGSVKTARTTVKVTIGGCGG